VSQGSVVRFGRKVRSQGSVARFSRMVESHGGFGSHGQDKLGGPSKAYLVVTLHHDTTSIIHGSTSHDDNHGL
jgi:hypothetical protein